jgi:hypothetical protein
MVAAASNSLTIAARPSLGDWTSRANLPHQLPELHPVAPGWRTPSKAAAVVAYVCTMSAPSEQPIVIEGRVVHRSSNALEMAFHDGPGDPFAVGVQGRGDGFGKKLGTLFGFKNGGAGHHTVTYRDGSILEVASNDGAPSLFTRAGEEVAVVTRGATSTASSHGNDIVHFLADPDEAVTVDLFRLIVTGPSGGVFGRLDVIRKLDGWTVSRALYGAVNELFWWDQAGQAMSVPILGTRLTLTRPLVGPERHVLVGACVDMAIGLRPYLTEMK